MEYIKLKSVLLNNKLISICAEGVYDSTSDNKIFEKIYFILENRTIVTAELIAPHFEDDAELIFESSGSEPLDICYQHTFESAIIDLKCFGFKKIFSDGPLFQLELELESLQKISIGYYYIKDSCLLPIVTGEVGITYDTIESNLKIPYFKI